MFHPYWEKLLPIFASVSLLDVINFARFYLYLPSSFWGQPPSQKKLAVPVDLRGHFITARALLSSAVI